MSNQLKLIYSPLCLETYFHQGTQQTLVCKRPEGHGGSFHEGNFPLYREGSMHYELSGTKWLWPTVDSVYNQQVPSVPLIPLTADDLKAVIQALHSGGYAGHTALIEKFEEALKGTQ